MWELRGLDTVQLVHQVRKTLFGGAAATDSLTDAPSGSDS
jgi:hypothetical protein